MLWWLFGFPNNFNFFKHPQPGNDMAFHVCPCYWNSYIPKQNKKKGGTWELSVFSHVYPVNFGMFVLSLVVHLLWEFTFLTSWELYGFLLLATDVRNLWLCNVWVSLYFSHSMAIHLSHVFEIIGIHLNAKHLRNP